MKKIDLPQFNCRRALLNGRTEAIWLYTYEGVLTWIQQRPDLPKVVYQAGKQLPEAQLVRDVAQFSSATVTLDVRDAFLLAAPGIPKN